MILKTNIHIDDIKINFDTEALWMLNIALAIIMFGVALDIKITDFKLLFKQPKILFTGILSQFILLPVITFLAILVLEPHPSFALGMLLVASCPGGNISNFFSKMANGNTALSISLTASSTLVCIFFTPLNLQLWGSLYEPTNAILKTVSLNPFDLLKLVLLILGIPLVLGMLVNHYKEKLASKMNTILKPFSILVFLALIVIACFKNITAFKEYIHLVIFLVIFHNILAYCIGFCTAKIARLNKKEIKTITIETGIQNGGLGLLLIFSFFNGLGGMAILVAFWGIWDIISGLTLAYFWGRKEEE